MKEAGELTDLDVGAVKTALEAAGLEIYRVRAEEIQLAERVRLHIMDSGVRVVVVEATAWIRFTVRSQKSDFPNAQPDELFERVRVRVGDGANERGFTEKESRVHQVTDPVDENKVLDVWHEVVYEKALASEDELVDEVRWALAVEKYVAD